MSEVFLFTVVEAFQISGRPGPVLVPGITLKGERPDIRTGAPIVIVTPGGTRFATHIASIEMPNYGRRPPPVNPAVPIGLPSPLSKEHIPAGSQVYLADTTDPTG